MSKSDKNPCWDGYEQVGMKDKDGKQVPNCVPKDSKKGVVMKKAIVLKGFNSEIGATDYLERMQKFNIEDFKDAVVTKSLDGYSKVTNEKNLTSSVFLVKETEVVTPSEYSYTPDAASAVLDVLAMKGIWVTEDGVSGISEGFVNALNSMINESQTVVTKSVSDDDIEYLDDNVSNLVNGLDFIVKALEDANKLANLAPAAENATTGHPEQAATPISDEEAKAAQDSAGKHIDTGTDGSAISDSEVDTAEHLSSHITSTKAMDATGSAAQALEGQDLEDTKKSETEEDSDDSESDEDEEMDVEKSVLNTVFKSLNEARNWQNPDVERYFVDATNFDDKKTYGKRYSYIVRARAPKVVTGAYGNKLAS